MKHLFSVFLASVLACAWSISPASAAGPLDVAAAKEQVAGFYKLYLHALNNNGDPLTKDRDALKRYLSAGFLKKVDRLSKVEGGLEADPFICAQDFDKDWEKNIKVQKAEIRGKAATTQVELTGREIARHHLIVKLIREAGGWKIDRVDGVDVS